MQRAILSVLLASAVAVAAALADETKPPEGAAPTAPPPSNVEADLDDPVEPLAPAQARSGRQTDRVHALGLFAAARVAEQKQDYARALRLYQRAWRLDPTATLALREIVPLAFNLERQAEAVRYALIMAEREGTDPVMLRRLALYLTEEGDNERALRMYEKALSLEAAGKTPANPAALRMEMGRLCFVSKKYDQAAAHFAEVMAALANPDRGGLDAATQKALSGKPELTYQLFGESFLEADRPADARTAFDEANKAKGDEGLYAYNIARVLAKEKQPAQALAQLQTYFDKHLANQGTAPYELLTTLLGQLGQEGQLIPRLEKLRSEDEGNLPLAYYLAGRYRAAGDLDKAEPIYAKLVETHKTRPPLEAYQNLVEIYVKQKNVDKLIATLGDAVGRIGSLTPLGDSGKALVADTEMARAVVTKTQERLAAEPDKVDYGQRLAAALVAIELKDYAAADALFPLVIAAEPKKAPDTLLTWGLELFAAEKYPEAIKVFQRGLADKLLPEKDPRLYYYLAGALAMEGQADAGVEAARKAAELQNDAPRFAGRVAWIQYHAKRYDEARASYLAIINKHDKNHEAPEVREALRDARLALSNLCVVEKKMDEAEEWIEQVLDEFPEDTSAQNDLGYLWADADKHLERSLAMIQAAVAAEPKNMAYRDSLGWVLFRLGRFDEAAAELRAASSGDDPDAVILDHLGDALAKAGDKSGALDAWKRAADGFDKRSDAEKAKAVREKIPAPTTNQ